MSTAIITVRPCGECQTPRVETTRVDYISDLWGDVQVLANDMYVADIDMSFIDENVVCYVATIHGSGGVTGPTEDFPFYSESDEDRADALLAAKMWTERTLSTVEA